MRWQDMTSVLYVREWRAHTHGLSTGAKLLFQSANTKFRVAGVGDVTTNKIVVAILCYKLAERFTDGKGQQIAAKYSGDPKSSRLMAQHFRRWGDSALAEEALRTSIPYVDVFDKGNIDAYLDDYADVLKKLGRSKEAQEIETRSEQRIKELCRRRTLFEPPA